MNDDISIQGQRIKCIIGCNPEERITPQYVIVTVHLSCDCHPAGLSDRLEDTVNYHHLSQEFIRIATEGQFHLIETLAERIAVCCLKDRRIMQVEVTVEKPGALYMTDCAAVTIIRKQEK